MLCEVAALPFQAHANDGTWSIHRVWVQLHFLKFLKNIFLNKTLCKTHLAPFLWDTHCII